MLMIKICGITRLEDAIAAVEAGANLLGFNFYPASPRCVQPEQCKAIIDGVREAGLRAGAVGVFVNTPVAEISQLMESCGLHIVQLSGDEPASFINELGGRAYKALRPTDAADLQDLLSRYPIRPFPPAWLLDAHRPGEYGGTGQTADWSLAAGLARQAPILLAGGLTPDNVAAAIQQVRPWGVDVASGVENTPGRKDPDKMRRFVQYARSA